MSKLLYESRLKITKEVADEYVGTFYKGNKMFTALRFIIPAVLLVISIPLAFWNIAVFIAFLVAGLFCLIAANALYFSKTSNDKKTIYGNSEEGKEPESVIQFFDDEIVFTSRGDSETYKYDVIKQTSESKNLFILVMDSGSTVIIDKRTFSLGDPAKFARFIKMEISNQKENPKAE